MPKPMQIVSDENRMCKKIIFNSYRVSVWLWRRQQCTHTSTFHIHTHTVDDVRHCTICKWKTMFAFEFVRAPSNCSEWKFTGEFWIRSKCNALLLLFSILYQPHPLSLPHSFGIKLWNLLATHRRRRRRPFVNGVDAVEQAAVVNAILHRREIVLRVCANCACGNTVYVEKQFLVLIHQSPSFSRYIHHTPYQNLHELYSDIMHERNCKLCETKRQHHTAPHRTTQQNGERNTVQSARHKNRNEVRRKKNCNEIVGFRADINYMYYV